MASVGSELAGINAALQCQEKIVKECENHLFLEHLRLASLKAARDRALRAAILSDLMNNSNASRGSRHKEPKQ
jgi:hypothetical protein